MYKLSSLIISEWTPGHSDIKRNEEASKAVRNKVINNPNKSVI